MKHIIFDVDGTLWDTTEVVARAWQRAVDETGLVCEPITGAVLKREFGKTMNLIADSLFPMATEAQKQQIMDLCCQYEHEDLHGCSDTLLYPDVRETLISLSLNHSIYIVSNCQSGYIELFLEKNKLDAYVKDMECYGNTGMPKGENIKRLMARNQIEDALYVGDTQGDYEATLVAGIPFIYASYGFGNPEGYAHKIEGVNALLTAAYLEV